MTGVQTCALPIYNALAAVKSALPIGEVQNKLSSFADTANNLKGSILSLADNQKNTLIGKISEVASAASDKGLEFNVDDSLKTKATSVIASAKNIIGKHTFPLTENTEGNG